MVADALDSIPPELGDAHGQRRGGGRGVADAPSSSSGRPAARCSGLYEGVPLTSRGPLSYAGVAPDRITVFRGPICRARPRRGRARARRCGSTVLHEVGHYFGMSDERLHELGWA